MGFKINNRALLFEDMRSGHYLGARYTPLDVDLSPKVFRSVKIQNITQFVIYYNENLWV